MKIKILSIKTEGLRCPNLEINFPITKKIHFLQMPNGTGKTTLINLIKNTLSNSWNKINTFKAKDSKKNFGSFQIQLQIISENFEDKLTFRVELDFNSNSHEVFTTQNKLSEKPGFHPSRDIKQFFSKSHIETFLFSGDKLDDYFDDTKDIVRETVDTFSGVSKINKLSAEIEKIFDDKMKGKKKSSSQAFRTKKQRLEIRLQHINDNIQSYEKKVSKIKPRWSELNKLIENREDDNTEINEKINAKQEEIDTNNAELSECESELAEMMKNLYNIAPSLQTTSKKFLETLKKQKLPGTSKEFFVGIASDDECICGSEMTKEKSKNILENIDAYLGNEDVYTTNAINSINAANINSANNEEYIQKVDDLERLYEEFMSLEDEMFDLKQERDRTSEIYDEIQEFKELDKTKSIHEGLITNMKNDVDETTVNVKKMDPENIKSISGVKLALTHINQKIAEKEGYEENLNKMEKFKEVLEVSSFKARKSILEELRKQVNKKIHSSHQDSSFMISDIDKSLNIDNQEGGSGGQQVTAVTSFALSILERSGVEFPLLIDHPVTPLHYEARPAISKMLTNICDQSICFVINTEKPGFITEDLNTKIHSYLQDNMSLHTIYRTNEGVRQPKEVPDKKLTLETSNGKITSDKNFFLNFTLESEDA